MNILERFQELGMKTKVEERNVRLYTSTEDLAVRRTQNLKGEWYSSLLEMQQEFFAP